MLSLFAFWHGRRYGRNLLERLSARRRVLLCRRGDLSHGAPVCPSLLGDAAFLAAGGGNGGAVLLSPRSPNAHSFALGGLSIAVARIGGRADEARGTASALGTLRRRN